MSILELHGLKVLPLPDLGDESLCGLPGGGATTAVQWGGERGFGRGHERRRQAALPLVAGSSRKIPNSVSWEAQDGQPSGVDRTVPK